MHRFLNYIYLYVRKINTVLEKKFVKKCPESCQFEKELENIESNLFKLCKKDAFTIFIHEKPQSY